MLVPPIPTTAVNSVFEKSSGRIRNRGFNRFLGTLMGAAWSCVVIGLTWLINGGYHETATKCACRGADGRGQG